MDDSLSLDTSALAAAIRDEGFVPTKLDWDMFVTEICGKVAIFRSTNTPTTNAVAIRVAKRKHIARVLLANAGVSVADGAVFSGGQLKAAEEYAYSLGSPVVLKPTNGRKGRQVSVGLTPGPEFERAFADIVDAGHDVLLERQFVGGDEARFLVVGDRCLAVYGKLQPHVVGDGIRTIEELIDVKNRDRSQNPHLRRRLIKLTPHRRDELRRQGYSADDVPPAGVNVLIDQNANVSAGGDSFDLTGEVDPSYKEIAVTAAAAVGGLEPAGVDIIARDFGEVAKPADYIVCEVNSRPALGAHHYPARGSPRNVARAIAAHTIQELCGQAEPMQLTTVRPPRRQPNFPSDDAVENGETFDRDAQLLALEWMRRGYDVHWLSQRFFIVQPYGVTIGYWGTASTFTFSPGIAVSYRKDLMRQLLSRAKLVVPEGRVYRKRRSLPKARAIARSLGTVVVKPVDGLGGIGLTTAVQSRTELDNAWHKAHASSSYGVIVEKQSEGVAARFLVVGDRCIAVRDRHADLGDLSDAVHSSYKDLAARAVQAISSLDLATVDIISADFDQMADESNHVIVDIDSTPSIWEYHSLGAEQALGVPKAIVDHHLARARGQSSQGGGRRHSLDRPEG